MTDLDLLQLDIRLLSRYSPSREGSSHLDLFHRVRDRELALVSIENGWDVLEEARRSILKSFRFPAIIPSGYHVAQRLLGSDIKRTEVGEREFRDISRQFFTTYVFDALEGRSNLNHFLDTKQDMPISYSERDLREARPPRELVEIAEDKTRAFIGMIRADPSLIGLPDRSVYGPPMFYEEVRFDNRLSRCIVTENHYAAYVAGSDEVTSSFCIPDLIAVYPGGTTYVVECKVGFKGGKRSRATPGFVRKKIRSQLSKAGAFLQRNFNVNPVLVSAHVRVDLFSGQDELSVNHYRFNRNID